jgi:hypothetical protein
MRKSRETKKKEEKGRGEKKCKEQAEQREFLSFILSLL